MSNLIDADSLLYRAGFVANEEGQENLAKWQLDKMIDDLPTPAEFFISGSENFRFAIYPDYKGNRKGMKRPIHLPALREHIVTEYGAQVSSDGREADDDVGIASNLQPDALICHIDKDLNMLIGKHWNYVTKAYYSVTQEQAFRNFFIQMLMGDKADNIPGYDGKMRQKVPQFMEGIMSELQECSGPEEMFDLVLGWYQEDLERFDLSARCLWIQRKPEDDYLQWLNGYTMAELGREDDFKNLLDSRANQEPIHV